MPKRLSIRSPHFPAKDEMTRQFFDEDMARQQERLAATPDGTAPGSPVLDPSADETVGFPLGPKGARSGPRRMVKEDRSEQQDSDILVLHECLF